MTAPWITRRLQKLGYTTAQANEMAQHGDILGVVSELPTQASEPGGDQYEQVFTFAQPLTTWVIAHGQGSFALDVQTFDPSGETLEGNVRFTDVNTLEIDWYFPTAGLARLFR